MQKQLCIISCRSVWMPGFPFQINGNNTADLSASHYLEVVDTTPDRDEHYGGARLFRKFPAFRLSSS